MPRAIRPVRVAGIEFDALIDEQRQLDAEIPQFTTEEGFQISDAIIVDAETLSMTLYVTDTPVTWRGRHPGKHADAVCSRLEAAYFNREPISIETTDRSYYMMGIQSITFQKSLEIGYSKEIPITFKKIRITKTQQIAGAPVNYPGGGSSGANSGAANTSEANTADPSSMAWGAVNGLSGGALENSGSGIDTSNYSNEVTGWGGNIIRGRSRTNAVYGVINNNNTGSGYNPSQELGYMYDIFQ